MLPSTLWLTGQTDQQYLFGLAVYEPQAGMPQWPGNMEPP